MKSVLITGGTTRLGAVLAQRLRAEGWRVLTSSHRPEAPADIQVDLTTEEGCRACGEQARQLLNGQLPDALVNNAALFTGEEKKLRALNLDAPRALTKWMAARSSDSPRGVVVNILDCRILKPSATPDNDVYTATKRALLSATHSDARRYIHTARVNAVLPGPILPPTAVHEKAGQTPLGRPTADEVAAAISFLLTANTTTDCIIPVDGGQALV